MRYTDWPRPPSQITETVFVEINEYMYYVVSAPVGVLPGTLCTSIEEPLPSKWASRALKYLHSGFKPWTRLPQVLIMEEIETFPVLWLSALQQSGAGHKNTGWTVDSSARSCLMSGSSGPCSVFTLST